MSAHLYTQTVLTQTILSLSLSHTHTHTHSLCSENTVGALWLMALQLCLCQPSLLTRQTVLTQTILSLSLTHTHTHTTPHTHTHTLCSENTVGALWLSSSVCVGPSLHSDCAHSTILSLSLTTHTHLCSENTVGALWLSSSVCVGPSLHSDCAHSDDTLSRSLSHHTHTHNNTPTHTHPHTQHSLCSENTVGALWLSSSVCVGPSLHTDCAHSDVLRQQLSLTIFFNTAQVWR